MVSQKIVCRAQVHASCYHGSPTRRQFGDDLPMSEDGTFNGSSIVCDACYVALMPETPSGAGRFEELDDAIRRWHEGHS